MRIIIPTCDRYRNILEANKYTMDKFGGADMDVTVLGFKQPDFDMGNWKFVSLGTDTGAKNFSNDLMKFFIDFDDEYFIYAHDDVVITNTINTTFLNEIIETIKEVPNFGKIWLLKAPPDFYGVSSTVKDFGTYKIDEIRQQAEYRLSLQTSIWKTNYFKRYLQPNLSPWDWELRSNAKNDGANILIPNGNHVIGVGHVMKQGHLIPNWFTPVFNTKLELTNEDIEIIGNILRKHGYSL